MVTFDKIQIPLNEISFIIEVINILGNDSIELLDKINLTPITKSNVFSLIKKHEKNDESYSKEFCEEIDFIASNFFYFCEKQREQLFQISNDTLSLIVNNSLLQLSDEDQLLNFNNQLYSKDSKYSVLYESVLFSNISSNNMKKFIKNLNFEDLNKNVWREISNALEVNDDDDEDEDKKDISKIKRYSQYQSQGIKFYPDEKKPFNGIINYLIDKSENKIEKEVIITVSSSSPVFPDPNSVVSYKNLLLGGFRSKDEPNSWICFYFKKHQLEEEEEVMENHSLVVAQVAVVVQAMP